MLGGGARRSAVRLVACLALCGGAAAAVRTPMARAQEGVFLTEEQAPAAVLPDATDVGRTVLPATQDLRDRVRALVAPTALSVSEDAYVTFTARRGEAIVGYAIVVEEIGKHRPITFVVGIRPDGTVNAVAVMSYREAYGGEIRNKRFLSQYPGKTVRSRLQTYGDIQNVAGATLSVDAANRAVKKALALAQVLWGVGGPS
jgi:Na+-translocating ferredoxin:NAD+ oxidoreductase RnfG subunit